MPLELVMADATEKWCGASASDEVNWFCVVVVVAMCCVVCCFLRSSSRFCCLFGGSAFGVFNVQVLHVLSG